MTEFNEKLFANAMASAMAVALGQKAPATGDTSQYFHGPGGLFGGASVEERVLSTRIVPQGISSVLPAFPSVFTHPEFGYITGVEDDSDSEPQTECATCPGGIWQTCVQTAPFGRVCRETETYSPSRYVQRVNRFDQDYVLANSMMGEGDLFQPIKGMDKNSVLQRAVTRGMLTVGMLMQNKFVPMTWQGTPGNNVGTGYAEFNGLDLLISTGKVDAHTLDTCEALDSDVKDFNYQNISTIKNDGFLVVEWLEALERYCHRNARGMNMLPATWAFVMREEAWYELTRVWPIAYHTTRGFTLPTSVAHNIDAGDMIRMRDAMRAGMYLDINGRRHQVLLDDGILEQDSGDNQNIGAGCFASNIYFVPLTYMGMWPATYYEYLDYGQALFPELRGKQDWWTDGGRYLWTIEQQKWCFTVSALMEPRIVLRTPYMAGRLDNVLYCPTQHTRQPFPDDDYFVKGGVTDRPSPSLEDDYTRTL